MTELEMETRLKSQYPDADVAVIDSNGSGSYFEVRISKDSFSEMSRVERHQAVMAVFDNELKSGEVHALTIKFL